MMKRLRASELRKERWQPVVGAEEDYEVSDLGRVRSVDRTVVCIDGRCQRWQGRPLNPFFKFDGYPYVDVFKGVHTPIHRLVLSAFVGSCPEGMESLHDDGNRKNSRLNNLRWGTRKENQDDSERHGTVARGTRHGHTKLTVDQIIFIRKSEGLLRRELADMFGVCPQHIGQILHGKCWKELV